MKPKEAGYYAKRARGKLKGKKSVELRVKAFIGTIVSDGRQLLKEAKKDGYITPEGSEVVEGVLSDLEDGASEAALDIAEGV